MQVSESLNVTRTSPRHSHTQRIEQLEETLKQIQLQQMMQSQVEEIKVQDRVAEADSFTHVLQKQIQKRKQ